MNQHLTVHLLPPSPNNVKAMVALAYKGIDYNTVLLDLTDPESRQKIVRATGQALTPALTHGETKVFDSGAILRYLDANFPGARLFSEDREAHKEIEKWENYHRHVLGAWLSRAFTMFFNDIDDAEEVAAINAGMHSVTEELETALEGQDWLVGDSMSAADITVGSFLSFACFTDDEARRSPVWQWMKERFDLGEGRDRCRALSHRVLSYLPAL